jgi:hypothetical protein
MSIAEDEAENKYPAPTDADDPMCKYVESIAGYPAAKRQGYVAGRTAEPTDAEIDAALPELIEAYRQESELVTDRDYVSRILSAARKAVAE